VQDAIGHIEHALALYSQSMPSKDPNFRLPLESVSHPESIANQFISREQGDKFQELLAQLASITAKKYGDTSPQYCRALAELVVFQAMTGKVDDSFKQLSKALRIYSQHIRDPFTQAVRCYDQSLYELNMASEYLCQRGDVGKAIELALEVLRAQDALLANDEQGKAQTLSELGSLYVRAGKYEDAERSYRRACEIQQKSYGISRIYLAEAAKHAAVLRHLGRNKEAEELMTFEEPPAAAGHQFSGGFIHF
jgi:tetratricopeptide (TPR) repeat protein